MHVQIVTGTVPIGDGTAYSQNCWRRFECKVSYIRAVVADFRGYVEAVKVCIATLIGKRPAIGVERNVQRLMIGRGRDTGMQVLKNCLYINLFVIQMNSAVRNLADHLGIVESDPIRSRWRRCVQSFKDGMTFWIVRIVQIYAIQVELFKYDFSAKTQCERVFDVGRQYCAVYRNN